MYRLKKIQEKKKINKQKAEALKKAKGITNGENIYNNSQNTSCKVPFGATGTIQTAYLQNLHNKLTLLTDQNWPIMTNLHYLSLTASNMTAKLTN